MTEFWHHLVTDKSFSLLQEFQKRFKFVLIGGWAVYLYTKSLKSKDIDIIVGFEELGKLRQNFDLIKNERLKKYEIRADGFDVDIYVPHWSELGVPLDFVIKNTSRIEGFTVPKKEALFALKLFVYTQRKAALKGKKDLVDIISLLYRERISFASLHKILKGHGLADLLKELKSILETTFEIKELGLNQKRFSDFKKPILAELKKI